MTDKERSVKQIRQDITKEGENLFQIVSQIDDRIKENLNWRTYMRDSPFWMLGAATGLGFVASRLLQPRTTPTQRMIDSIAREIPRSLGTLITRTAGPGVLKMTLLGVATKIAADRLMNTAIDAGSATGEGKEDGTSHPPDQKVKAG